MINRLHTHREKVDMIRTVTLPHLELFGISDGLELRVSEERLASCEESLIPISR